MTLFVCNVRLPAQSTLDLSSGPRDTLYLLARAVAAPDATDPTLIPIRRIRLTPFDDTPVSNPLNLPRESDSKASFSGPIQPRKSDSSENKVHWKPAILESLLYTGIMHTFNIVSEAGTRDALNGPWLRQYLDSVGELRGWSDSDTFMAPYLGHPIEGSIFGYIFRQNDPRYRDVQWGDGRDYFVSVLRSMAYSAVWHTQWKIGPVSEASIGNVMLHASPGFITLVDTPTLGALTMMAEDAADRYWILGLENHTTNRFVIVMARSFLNPGRSFANLMAFHVPWGRDGRLGLHGEDFQIRKELVREYREGSGERPFEFVRRSPDINGVEFHHNLSEGIAYRTFRLPLL